MSKSKKRKKSTKKPIKKKEEKLTFKDVLLALFFIFSFVYFIIAFATSTMPINDSFVIYPIIVGIISGVIGGYFINKYIYRDSTIFFMLLFALIFSLLFTAVVISFNRPLDRSPVSHNKIVVTNKFKMGGGDNIEYYFEVKNFPKRRLQVEKSVYEDVEVGDSVDVLIRKGFFHFPYIEDIIPVGIDINKIKKIPIKNDKNGGK